MEVENILIIDHGSFNIKYGLITELKPNIMRSLGGAKRVTVGKNMIIGHKPTNDIGTANNLYGDEAIEKANVLRIENTIENKVELRLGAKGLYKKILDEYNLFDGEIYNIVVLYLVSSFVDKNFVNTVSELFKDQLNVKDVKFISQAKCAGYFTQTDAILDIGESITEFNVLENNNIILSDRSNIGGKDLTSHLKGCFEDGEYFKLNSIEEIRIFKERNIFVASSDEDKSNIEKLKLVVDDGSEYEFSKEIYECGEILFNPSIIKKNEKNIIDIIKSKINTAKISKLFILGGSSRIKNLRKRVESEFKDLGIELHAIDAINVDEINWLGAKKMFDDAVLFEKLDVEFKNENSKISIK